MDSRQRHRHRKHARPHILRDGGATGPHRWERTETGWQKHHRDREEQEGIFGADNKVATRARRSGANKRASARLLWGRRSSISLRFRRPRAGVSYRRHSWNRRKRLATEHRISRRLPRLASSHHLVLACDWKILQRATTEIIAICHRNELNSDWWVCQLAGQHWPETILHREVGEAKLITESSHMFQ